MIALRLRSAWKKFGWTAAINAPQHPTSASAQMGAAGFKPQSSARSAAQDNPHAQAAVPASNCLKSSGHRTHLTAVARLAGMLSKPVTPRAQRFDHGASFIAVGKACKKTASRAVRATGMKSTTMSSPA